MNTYRIHFHQNENFSLRTILLAASFEEASKKVHDKINKYETFIIESKENRQFTVMKENIAFIEIELLKRNNKEFDDLLSELNSLTPTQLQDAFSGIKNNYISTAFKHNIDVLENSYSSYIKGNVLENIIQHSHTINPLKEDILTAINFIRRYVSRFQKK